MGSKWKKAKLALGLNLCVFVPRTSDDLDLPPATERLSDAALLSPVNWDMASSRSSSAAPAASSHALTLSKSASKSSKVSLLSFNNLHFFLHCCSGFRNFNEIGSPIFQIPSPCVESDMI